MNQNQKIIIIGIVSILVILTGFALFYIFYIKQNPSIDNTPIGGGTDFQPFGSIDNGTSNLPQKEDETAPTNSNSSEEDKSKLKKVSNDAVAGAIVFNTTDNKSFIRYITRADGHVYEADASLCCVEKLSNTTIPKIRDAYWLDNDSFILRYLNSQTGLVDTFYGVLKDKKATSTEQLSVGEKESFTKKETVGFFLPNDIKDLAISPDNKNIFYLKETSSGSTGVFSNPDGTKASSPLPFILKDWLVSWPLSNTLFFNNKPTGITDGQGFLFSLNKKLSSFTKEIGPVQGLTSLVAPNGSDILYSKSQNNTFLTYHYDTKTKKTDDFSFNTLPEKCIWSKKDDMVLYCAVPKTIPVGTYPDAWYQGLIFFNDVIWKVDLKNALFKQLSDPFKDVGKSIDAIKLSLDQNENYLLFINKRDSSLWRINLTE